MSDFRRHDKIQLWLNRPVAVECCLVLYGEPNGYWWLDTRLDPDRWGASVRERAAPETVDTARVAHLDLLGHRRAN